MKTRVFVIIMVIAILLPINVIAETVSPLKKLDGIANEALQMTKINRYDDAKRLLDYFSEEFLTITAEERLFSMDELRIVTVAHNEALEASTSVSLQHNERVNELTKFRLILDAIATSHQPLWTEMEDPMMKVFNEVKLAVAEQNQTQFHTSFNKFLSLYEVIYPSIKIDVKTEQIQKVEARINFIDHYRHQVLTDEKSQQELAKLGEDLKVLFDQMTEDEADPSLWWVIISTGSIIIITLSYVGWRKYKGDKEEKKKRKELKH